jgi:hypothetical protein
MPVKVYPWNTKCKINIYNTEDRFRKRPSFVPKVFIPIVPDAIKKMGTLCFLQKIVMIDFIER